MGNDAAVLRKIKLGQLQGGAFTGAELSTVYKDATIYSTPFQFRDQGEIDFARSKLDDELRRGSAEAGMVPVGIAGGGFAYLFSTKQVRNREELKATKVWAPSADRIAQIAFESAGVQPTTLPLSDVYTALQTGLVETVANTTAGAIAFQWHTKLKYMVDLPLTYVVGYLVVDKKVYEQLAPGDQQALSQEIQKAFDTIDAANRRDNESARGALTKQGIQIVVPSAEETAYWQGVGAEALKRLNNEHTMTPELQAKLKAALAEYRAAHPQSDKK
jgi:TRAP-type C4-dicarboxylate transport system substrate-binding protein